MRHRIRPLSVLALLLFPGVARAQDPAAAETEEIAKFTGARLIFLESANFTFATAVPRSEMRPIIQTAEDAFARFAKAARITGFRDLFGEQRCMVVILGNRTQYRKYAEWYETRYSREAGFRAVADGARFFPVDTPRPALVMHLKPADAGKLQSVVCHEVGHVAVMRLAFNNNFSPPWLCEGYGAWLESRVLSKNDCYCISGGYESQGGSKEDPLAEIRFEKFRERLQKALRSGNLRRLNAIWRLNLSEMEPGDLLKAWAVIDLMHAQGEGKFADFIRALKARWPREIRYEWVEGKGTAQEEALKEVFGWTVDQLEEELRKHVPRIS